MAADLQLPHQLPAAYKTLTARCHCKSTHFTVQVPTSALPLPVHLCHCSICRTTHGTFCCFHAPLPKGVEPEFVAPSSIDSSLTSYIHSPDAPCERFFCSTCGCHIGDRDLKPDPETGKPEWRVATSIFTAPHDEATFQLRSHCFTTRATEPNLSTWLPSVGSRTMHIWNPSPEDPEFPFATHATPQPDIADDQLLGECHCAGVRFTLAAPSRAEADHPLLSRFLRPNPTPSSSSSSSSDNDPADPCARATGPSAQKRVACVCVCDDCRLVSGAHAVPWLYAPLCALSPAPKVGLESEGEQYGTLKWYRSSEKVRRAFCGTCGATVFYAVDHPAERGEGEDGLVIDVAVGIMRGKGGGGLALEKWLAWRTGRLAGMRNGRAFDKVFAESLAEGMREWGVKRYGESVDFNIPQDPKEW